MKFPAFNSTWQQTISSNRIMVLANIGLVAVVLMQQSKISADKERIVVTPPHVAERMEVAWNEATPGYYKSIAQWLSGTLASVNEKNIGFVKGAVEQYFTPAVRKEMLIELDNVANDPLRKISGTVSWFETRELFWEEKTKRVFVSGDLVSTNPKNDRGDRKKVTYEYLMKMNNGLPWIVEFNSYEGPARTSSYMNSIKAVELEGEQGIKAPAGEEKL